MPIYKRLFDFTISSILLVLLSPLFLMIYLIIKATSPGPGFFVQPRLGLNGKIFKIFKFRTMVDDAEKMQPTLENLNESQSPAFKIKHDPRITSVGSILRRSSMDELPQLINVLRGDMSLVGPRPLPLRDYDNGFASWQETRLGVRPGITCLWQVSGRSRLSYEEWRKLDIDYIENVSFRLDMKILAETIPAILRQEGAY